MSNEKPDKKDGIKMSEKNESKTQTSVFKDIRSVKENYQPKHYLERGARRHLENIAFFIIGFLFFPFGIMLWAYFHESRPKDAIYPLIAAIINFFVIMFNVFGVIFIY